MIIFIWPELAFIAHLKAVDMASCNNTVDAALFTIENLNQEQKKKVEACSLMEKTKNESWEEFVLVGPKKYCYQLFGVDILKAFRSFKIRSDDVWVFGVPRSGTTLTQEALWLIANNFNYQKASKELLELRFPLFESGGYPKSILQDVLNRPGANLKKETIEMLKQFTIPLWEKLSNTGDRRFMKTHLPLSFAPSDILSSGCKIVYVARNPLDLFVSAYMVLNPDEKEELNEGNFTNSFNAFREGLALGTPYFEHIKEGWKIREHKNVLFVLYEEINKDRGKFLTELANFLGKNLTKEQLKELKSHLEIENFRKNKSVNNEHWYDVGILKGSENLFIRKGQVGGYSRYFKGQFREEAQQWVSDNLKDIDLNYLIY